MLNFKNKKIFLSERGTMYNFFIDEGVPVQKCEDIPSMTYEEFSKPLVISNNDKFSNYLYWISDITPCKMLWETIFEELENGIDSTNEVGEAIKNTTVDFTADPVRLKEAKFIIVAVPTPVNDDTTPDLRPVEGASRTVGQNITPGTIVVFESTVYPGVTEDICVPIIEKESGLIPQQSLIAFVPEFRVCFEGLFG